MAGISHKYQKDYKKINYKNPRLLKEKIQKQRKLKKFLIYTAGVFFVLLIYGILFSPFLKIENIEITGINKISTEKFENIVEDYRYDRKFLIFSKNNLLIFSKKGLKKKIGESYLLETVNIDKTFPNKITINVVEKDAQIIWITNNKCFHLDEMGQAIENCDGGEVNNIIKIYDDANVDVSVSQYVIDKQILDYLIKCNENLNNIVKSDLYHINHDGPYSIRIETIENYDILINLELACEDQFARLDALIKSEDIVNNLMNIQYFDLRFGEKIYYK